MATMNGGRGGHSFEPAATAPPVTMIPLYTMKVILMGGVIGLASRVGKFVIFCRYCQGYQGKSVCVTVLLYTILGYVSIQVEIKEG